MAGVYSKLPGVKSLFSPLIDLLESNGQVFVLIFSPFELRLRAQIFKLPEESEECSFDICHFEGKIRIIETPLTPPPRDSYP